MTNERLSRSYLQKAEVRIKALKFLHQEKGYSDVVREAQECVELILKAVLRRLGIEIPKVHDVGRVLMEYRARIPSPLKENCEEVATISKSLRKDRELAFYGTDDFIPTEEYSEKESSEAIQMTERVYDLVSRTFTK